MPPVIKQTPASRGTLLQFALLLGAIVVVLFIKSFLPDYVHFSNDGPLSVQMSQCFALPAGFFGCWDDLSWLGFNCSLMSFEFTGVIKWAMGAVGYAKFLAPIAIFIFGICTWIFLKRLKLAPVACTLGALAAALNTTFLGTACWGVASQIIGFGMDYLALAMVVANTAATPRWLRWLRLVLAGFAVGVGVMEGADNGAIFSMFVACFVVYHTFVSDLIEFTPREKKVVLVLFNLANLLLLIFIPNVGLLKLIKVGIAVVTVATDLALFSRSVLIKKCGVGIVYVQTIALCAILIALQTIVGLVNTQIQGISGMDQQKETAEAHWDWATQWSTPKIETIGFVVPGLFGFRMNTPTDMPEWLQEMYRGGNYWGKVGRDPAWDRYFAGTGGPPDPRRQYIRFSGGGNYMGVLVALITFWTLAQTFRKRDSAFSLTQKRFIWFWAAAMLISMLLAFGRFAPFYQILYALPYFSTIRNPCKFTAVFNWSLVVVFAYGIDAIYRRYAVATTAGTLSPMDTMVAWWKKKAGGFDRKWIIGCFVAIVASLVAWLVYANFKEQLIAYLRVVQFGDVGTATAIATFSIRQVGVFILILVLCVVALMFVFSGAFAGRRAFWIGATLGTVLVADLAWNNLPYIVHWNYKEKYASNSIIDRLREKPYEQRVYAMEFPTVPEMELFSPVYKIEWEQQLFPYYNILTMGIVQMPRAPEVFLAFEGAFRPQSGAELYLMARHWELTSTRYLLSPSIIRWPVPDATGKTVNQNFQTLDFLNNGLDRDQQRFRTVARFEIVPKPGITKPEQYEQLTVTERPDGRYGLYEFTGALPRVKLYNQWQVSTNDQATLTTLASPAFSPQQQVIVAGPFAAPATGTTNQNQGEAVITYYRPADMIVEANAVGNSVLLVNDRYDTEVKVYVDGKRTELLRCNFVMRGVAVPAGKHTVEVLFRPSLNPARITMAMTCLAFVLAGVLIYTERKNKWEDDPTPPRKDAPRSSNNGKNPRS